MGQKSTIRPAGRAPVRLGGGAGKVAASGGGRASIRENPGNAENLTRAELRPRDPGDPVLVSLDDIHGKRRQ